MKLKLKFLVSQALNSLLWFLTKTRQEKVLFFFSNVCSGFPTQDVKLEILQGNRLAEEIWERWKQGNSHR